MAFSDPIAKGIYANGRESIILGLEDYGLRVENAARLISSVRNFYAGILHLLKSRLAEESKDSGYSLLMKGVAPVHDATTGNVKWVGREGKETADYHQIMRNINACVPHNHIAWNLLNDLRNYRNDIEHKYAQQSVFATAEAIASSRKVIEAIYSDVLAGYVTDRIPAEKWNVIADKTSEIERLRHDRDMVFSTVAWSDERVAKAMKELACPNCGNSIITVSDDYEPKPQSEKTSPENLTFVCRECGCIYTLEALACHLAELEYNVEVGDCRPGDVLPDYPVGACPECGIDAYNVADHLCYNCGNTDVYECARCRNEIPPYDLCNSSTLCGYCTDLYEKD